MKVLYLCTAYPPSIGGAQTHLHALINAMKEVGVQPRVAVHTQDYRRDFLRMVTIDAEEPGVTFHEGVEVNRVGLSTRGRWGMIPAFLSYYPTLGATLKWGVGAWRSQIRALAEEADVIHGVRVGREFLYQAALEVAREKGIPFVLTPCHHPRWRGPLYHQWDRIYRSANGLVALTDAERDLLVDEKRVPSERVCVTGIGPLLAANSVVKDGKAFRKKFGVDVPFVLFLGQQLPYKGIGAVLNARSALADRFPDLKFVFIGPRTEYSRRLFQASGSHPQIRELGPLSQEEKTGALKACELLCVPSSQESFGGVYVEAWACGKPVIALDTPQTAAVVEEGVDGLLARGGEDVARQISRLMADEGLRRRMGEAGRKKVENRYTWDRLARVTLDFYENLLV